METKSHGERCAAATAIRGNTCPIPSGSPATAELDFLPYARAGRNRYQHKIVATHGFFLLFF
jgi:hypothetical protein